MQSGAQRDVSSWLSVQLPRKQRSQDRFARRQRATQGHRELSSIKGRMANLKRTLLYFWLCCVNDKQIAGTSEKK